MRFRLKYLLSATAICMALFASFGLSRLLNPSSYTDSVATVKDIEGTGIPKIGGDFTLIDHHGQPRVSAEFQGHYMLVYFGYSFCPDICPAALSNISEALVKLGKKGDQIQPLFITVDPERDTVEHLALYVQNFHPRLIGLTGTPEQIKQAKSAYLVYATKATPDGTASEYLIDHSSIIYLMNPQGHMVAHFNHTTPSDEIVKKFKEVSQN